jgi:hypothetical protein
MSDADTIAFTVTEPVTTFLMTWKSAGMSNSMDAKAGTNNRIPSYFDD